MMHEELEYEYNQFLEDMKRGETFCRYLDETEYEDEYSHNDIDDCQSKFIEKARAYLHEHFPSKYVISGGWCVFVMTIDEAKKRNIHHYENYLVK